MKKSFIIFVLLGMACRGFGQPHFNTPALPSSVNLFDKFEITFSLNNFPSSIRDVNNHTINNTFGDAVFSMILFKNEFYNTDKKQ